MIKQRIDVIADVITTVKNLLHTLMADNAGITTRLEISRAPIILIPRTTVMDVRAARSML